jgi:Fe-S cluster biogenesis protein NfuA
MVLAIRLELNHPLIQAIPSRNSVRAFMFIQTEPTPNPATLKFLLGQPIMPSGTADFATAADAGRSPLAARLFEIPGVARVFLGSDFVSVSKAEGEEWHILKPAILGALMEHLTAGRPIIEDTTQAAAEGGVEDSEIVREIKELLDTRVRPAVAQDGGDIIYRGFDSGIVYLHLQGSCAGCPSSTATLKMGIENLLKHYIPEVEGVEAVGKSRRWCVTGLRERRHEELHCRKAGDRWPGATGRLGRRRADGRDRRGELRAARAAHGTRNLGSRVRDHHAADDADRPAARVPTPI